MKVVMLCKWTTDILSGGVAVHVTNLVKKLSKINDLDLTVISFGETSEVLYEGKTKIVLIKARKIYYLFPFLALIKLSREVSKVKPDLLHLQGGNFSPYLLHVLFFSKLKSVITFHSYPTKELVAHGRLKPNSLKYKLLRWLESYTLKKVDLFISVGLRLKELIIEEYGNNIENKFFFIPNGINMDEFDSKIDKNLSRSKLNISNEEYIIFHAKSFVQNNGQEYLIKAFPEILKKIPNSKLLLAGEGPKKSELIKFSEKLGISNRVKFLGNINHEKIPSYLAACDIVVIPSVSIGELEETSCILLLEAMAMKKPVIASDIGGLKESIVNGKNGILIPDKDSNEIVNNVLLLFNNSSLYQKLSENAFNYVKNERKWSKIASYTMDVYKILHFEIE